MRSKVGEFDDGIVLDAGYASWLGPLLGLRAAKLSRELRLFPGSYLVMKGAFTAACYSVGINDCSPYRLRHGGPSHDVAQGLRSLVDIKKRGRWAADSSVKRYEKSTLLHRIELELSAQNLAEAVRFQRVLPQKLRMCISRGV